MNPTIEKIALKCIAKGSLGWLEKQDNNNYWDGRGSFVDCDILKGHIKSCGFFVVGNRWIMRDGAWVKLGIAIVSISFTAAINWWLN